MRSSKRKNFASRYEPNSLEFTGSQGLPCLIRISRSKDSFERIFVCDVCAGQWIPLDEHATALSSLRPRKRTGLYLRRPNARVRHGVERDLARADAFYERPRNRSDLGGAYNAAIMLENGRATAIAPMRARSREHGTSGEGEGRRFSSFSSPCVRRDVAVATMIRIGSDTLRRYLRKGRQLKVFFERGIRQAQRQSRSPCHRDQGPDHAIARARTTGGRTLIKDSRADGRMRPKLAATGVAASGWWAPRGTLVGLTLIVAVFAGCARKDAPADPEASTPAPRVEGDKVTFAAGAPQLGYLTVGQAQERSAVPTTLTGRLVWNEDVTTRVFPAVSGRIVEVLANPGQRVVAGQVLARIRSRDFGQAQADARRATTDLTLAERSLVRARELLEHHAAAQKDLEAAEADHARAVSEKERATATLAGYGGDVAGAGVDGIFSLRAPLGGVVVEKTVGPGQEVRADQVGDKPLFVISDPRRLWLLLDVTETDVTAFRRDQPVVVHARALPGRGFKGRVEVVGEGLDPSTRTVKVRCAVDNGEALLRAEMYLTADVSLDGAGGVNVPTSAIFMKSNRHYVFVEDAPGRFQRREVKIGFEGHGRSVIETGVKRGEALVTDGCLLLEALLEGESS